MENTKRDLSLDFTKPRHRGGQPAPSLVTPILNLSTPELNKMISEEELAVLTPNGISSVIPQSNILPSPLIPTTVNANNIINTTNNISNHNNSNINSSGNNIQIISNGNNCANLNGNHNGQTRKSDKNRDVDMEKIEKKRERNRLAAKKCRQRKLETIDELRKTVSQMEQKYRALEMEYDRIRSDWEQRYQALEVEFERFKCMRNEEIGRESQLRSRPLPAIRK